jgi:hypothetical protein
VAEFHVLDALRHQQADGSDRPTGLAPAAEDRQTGTDLKTPLKSDDALDVRAIAGAQ